MVEKSHRWCVSLTMLGKSLQLKTTALLFFFLWLVKSLKIFSSSRSTADLMTLVSDRIARAFNRSGAT